MTTSWIIAIMLMAYVATLADHIRLSRRIERLTDEKDRLEHVLARAERDARIGRRDRD